MENNQNPYLAPKSEIVIEDKSNEIIIASLWQRLLGGIVDLLILYGLILLIIYFYEDIMSIFFANEFFSKVTMFIYSTDSSQFAANCLSYFQKFVILSIPFLLFGLLNYLLLLLNNQTIGKLFSNTRILTIKKKRNVFILFFKRYLILWIAFWVFNFLFADILRLTAQGFDNFLIIWLLIDILFVFRKDRRCLHDIIAGTQVVVAK